MAGLSTLSGIYKQHGDEFLKNLLDKHVIISKQIKGSFFGIYKKEGRIFFYKKNEPISKIDRILTKFYEKPITYIENLPNIYEIIQKIPENYFFVFSYIQSKDIIPILYLNYFYNKENGTYYNDNKSIIEWSNAFNVLPQPIYFEGKLNDDQKVKILEFVYTPKPLLIKNFTSISFSKYLISVLNSQNTNDIDDTECFIFRFYDDIIKPSNNVYTTKLIDPAIQDYINDNIPAEQPIDYIYLIIIDLMTFIQTYRMSDLSSIVNKTNYEENYINLINKIYKDFISKYGIKYLDIKLQKPAYLQNADFILNLDNVNDTDVINNINTHENFEEIYKILLNFFRKKKKTTNAILDTEILLKFNSIVDKIYELCSGKQMYEGIFPDYNEYLEYIFEDSNIMNDIDIVKSYEKQTVRKKVNIIIDSFQPITIEHINAAKLLYEKNGQPVLFLILHSNIKNDNSPFTLDIIKNMINNIITKYDFINNYIILHDNNIINIINKIGDKYLPITWAAGEKYVNDYILQLDYAKRKNIPYNIKTNIPVVKLSINKFNERLKRSLIDNNMVDFKEMTPDCIHSYFFTLKSQLSSLNI